MVNHYATLLLNQPGEISSLGNKSYFTARNYSPLELPAPLKRVHDILFPKDVSQYYKQFLCYSYLRLLESTKNIEVMQAYDSRISYDLNELQEYYRTTRISPPTSSNFQYTLLISGKASGVSKKNYYYDAYTIKQINFLPEISIYNDTDKLYLKGGKESATFTDDFRIPLVISSSLYTTKEIALGNTGLTFILSGNLGSFNATGNKHWNFIVEAPAVFDFNKIHENLKRNASIVEACLEYGKTVVIDENYKLWHSHFNSVYQFTGILNAYVERAHDLWLKRAM